MGATDNRSVATPSHSRNGPPIRATGQRSEFGSAQFSANRVLSPSVGRGGPLRRVRAWMLVLPVDAAMLMLPATWHPQHLEASATMAVVFLMLVCSAGRYRARLHLSVLDELPDLVAKMLTAGAVGGAVTALPHEQGVSQLFLADSAASMGLVVAGRVVVTQLILWSRRHQVTRHTTVVIGGGPVAAELAGILHRHARYGLHVIGFVDDGGTSVAERVTPRVGGSAELDRVVRDAGADVLLVADGAVSDRALLDM